MSWCTAETQQEKKKYPACYFHQEINFMGKHEHSNYQLHTNQMNNVQEALVHPFTFLLQLRPYHIHLGARAPNHNMDHCSPASQGIQHTNSAAVKHFVTTTKVG